LKRIGILLTGNGFYDGSSPWDVAFILRAIESKGTFPVPFAPDLPQGRVINHQTEEVTKEKRNALLEASRLVRGQLFKLEEIAPTQIDALIIPGGRGLLLTLTNFEYNSADCELYPPLKKLIRGLYIRGKPIAGIGYGAFVIALALRKIANPILTPGDDLSLSEHLERMGAIIVNVPPDEVVVDNENNIFTTPGITPEGSVLKGSIGITSMVESVIEAKRIRRRIDEGNRPERDNEEG